MIDQANSVRKKFRFIGWGIISAIIGCGIYYFCISSGNDSTTEINALGIKINVRNTEISFEKKVWDQGKVKQNSYSIISINFKNTGDNALVVYDVNSSCGCVGVVEWTNMPINPGAEGQIILRLDTSSPALVDKEVSVHSNTTPNPVKLRVRAEICKEAN